MGTTKISGFLPHRAIQQIPISSLKYSSSLTMLEHRWLYKARCLNMKEVKFVFQIILSGAMPQIFAGIG
jgi:ABC-type nitrate/sulfonate/bicarbonate transport system permease component